jgi:PEP-CTERM motif
VNTRIVVRLAALLAMSLSTAFASQFTTLFDVCQNTNCSSFGANYTGPSSGTLTDERGAIEKGGMDAFDFFGYVSNLGPLTLNRRVDAMPSENTYRFLDTYTNPTDSFISETVLFRGNLTHNGNHTILLQTPFLTVDKDNTDRIPTVAMVNGNDAWAQNNMSVSYDGREYILAIQLSLNPGQSVDILNFAFLAFDTGTVRNVAGDSALAESFGQHLVNVPDYSGLSAQDINKIVNFTPEPATVALVGLGLALSFTLRRRRR